MYYCCGYKEQSRPSAVSFHIYMDAMLPFGVTHTPQKFMQTYAKTSCK